MFSTLATLAGNRKGGFVWSKVQPLLSDFVNSMEASLGPASKFTPSLTHILLVSARPLPPPPSPLVLFRLLQQIC